MPVVPTVNNPSTLTVQQLIDYARLFPGTNPAFGQVGYVDEPGLSFANDVIQKILAKSNPWKWNAAKIPAFQTQPYQQDYPTNLSQDEVGWLQAAVCVDINNTSTPKPMPPMTCVLGILPTFICNRPQKLSWIPNSLAQTGSWPGANTVYKDPLVSNGGGPGNNPVTAITDSNGNIQVVTTYGTTGSVEPTWPVSTSVPGTTTTDGTVVWTLIDPFGVALRLDALATNNSVVWEIRALYQKKPPRITGLTQTFSPIPDDLNYLIKQGFLAFSYKQADSNKFQQEYVQWLAAIQEALGSADRELTEFGFYPAEGVIGGSGAGGGAYYPQGYVGWPGWQAIAPWPLLLYEIFKMLRK